jgi:hypothetical protein
VPYDNKIESQIAPPTDAQRSADARHRKFGVRELALAFIARCSPRARSGTSQLLKPYSRLLIANPELEFLATHTKRGSLRFPNRKEIAVFRPHFNEPTGPSRELSSPLVCPDDRRRRRRAIHQPISNRNSRFTEFRSTHCKHTPYPISNRNKNTHFTFPDSTSASHESLAANREPRTTTCAAFRSTIPARPHAYR